MTDLNRQLTRMYMTERHFTSRLSLRSSSGCPGDATLSRAEKRAILGILGLRCRRSDFVPQPAGGTRGKGLVPIDDILEALSSLDHSPRTPPAASRQG